VKVAKTNSKHGNLYFLYFAAFMCYRVSSCHKKGAIVGLNVDISVQQAYILDCDMEQGVHLFKFFVSV
jgi:hypothetical protein